ncbi:hypothetical protein GGQ59_001183 [Parvularcula dongshanensis]|uniref:VPLPA-CTERM sorting domain-containing protein n=2 Tax=Parvularcula dongshanensis TaxID=1173995 RepID=A0A840I1H4_9PROT|nr:hypothetical protein [Parvularcula dongshanensis]
MKSVAAVLAALGTLSAGAIANAAIELVSATNVVTPDSPVRFENNDVNDGGALVPANNTIDIVAGAMVDTFLLSFDVDESMPTPEGVGIYDFVLTVMGDMGTTGTFTITADEAGNGDQILSFASLGVMPNETLTFMFSGTGFSRGNPFTPQYTVIVDGVDGVVPIPAAGFLFAGALGAGGLLRRKKKA